MKIFTIISLLIPVFTITANAELDFEKSLKELLDSRVYEAPEVHRVPEKNVGDIQAIFYDTLPYKDKSTRAFAYMGIPESDKPVPAMVLVHGGGGKAFHEWVKVWNDRGYAAISMSLEGHMPNDQGAGKLRHEFSGPVRVGMFDDVERPLDEQWMYHAVSNVMLAHSLLRSLPEVDADRIGITGISWGGVLSSLISGVDDRYKCAMPVYGAGFLYDSKGHFKDMSGKTPEMIEKKKFWDPARHFSTGSIPTLWVNGDVDGHFSVNITSQSFAVTQDRSYMTIHPMMRHGHPPGWDPKANPEIYVFANQVLKGETPGLGTITKQPEGRNIQVTYESEVPVVEATVHYLKEKLTYRRKKETDKHASPGEWLKLPADIDSEAKTVTATLPNEAVTYYMNLKDKRGCLVSSVVVELEQ